LGMVVPVFQLPDLRSILEATTVVEGREGG
jgi:hypothetical protein